MTISEKLKLNRVPTEGASQSVVNEQQTIAEQFVNKFNGNKPTDQEQALHFIARTVGATMGPQQLEPTKVVEASKPVEGSLSDKLISSIVGGPNRSDLPVQKVNGRQAPQKNPHSR